MIGSRISRKTGVYLRKKEESFCPQWCPKTIAKLKRKTDPWENWSIYSSVALKKSGNQRLVMSVLFGQLLYIEAD